MNGQETEPPDFATLLNWLEGRLDPVSASTVAAQVDSGDTHVWATVTWLRSFLQVSSAVELREPPPFIRQSLRQAFARRRGGYTQAPAEYITHVLFDSRQDLAPAGARGGDGDDDVHLAFACPAGDLLLDLSRTPSGGFQVEGQVLLHDGGAATVFEATMAGPGYELRTVEGDQLGRFSLAGVRAGQARLRASNGEVTIVAALDVGPGGW